MTDVVIAGGGIIGCATAVALLTTDPGIDVAVVEPDPSYAWAATGRGTGGVRQLFTRPENIALSQVTLDVIGNWAEWAGEPAPELHWRPNGYLFVAGRHDVATLATNVEIQRRHGVQARWLEPEQLAATYPGLATHDLAGAVLSIRDGWLDPHAFFTGVRRKAQRLGATFITDRVVDFGLTGSVVQAAVLESGRTLHVDAVVNAAGTRAPELAATVGMPLPVEPMRRHEHFVHTAADLEDLPFVKDAAGLAIHPYRGGLSVGLVDFDHPGGEDFTVDVTYYDRVVAPALQRRLSGTGQCTLHRTWTGLYDQNRFDGNMIIGNWHGRLDNFYVASGFSGHGFMHAVGVGRGLAELIVHGGYRTIDLRRMGYQRVVDDAPYPEHGIR